jgi:hypothetical protein
VIEVASRELRNQTRKLLDRAKAKLAELLDISPGAKHMKEVNR